MSAGDSPPVCLSAPNPPEKCLFFTTQGLRLNCCDDPLQICHLEFSSLAALLLPRESSLLVHLARRLSVPLHESFPFEKLRLMFSAWKSTSSVHKGLIPPKQPMRVSRTQVTTQAALASFVFFLVCLFVKQVVTMVNEGLVRRSSIVPLVFFPLSVLASTVLVWLRFASPHDPQSWPK